MAGQVVDVDAREQLGTTVFGMPVVLVVPVVVDVVDELASPHEAGGFGTLQLIVAGLLLGPRTGAPPPESCLHAVNK